MRESEPGPFSLLMMTGGPDAGEAMGSQHAELFRLLSGNMVHRYSRDLDSFSICFCVDGSVFALGKSDVQGVRISSKTRRVDAKVYFARQDWMGRSADEIRDLAFHRIVQVLEIFAERITKKRLDFDYDLYRNDMKELLLEYRGMQLLLH